MIECFLERSASLKKKYTAEEAKTLILDAAAGLFIEKGYVETSISDIVREIDGLTSGAVYHHFKSKFDILWNISRRFIPDDIVFSTIAERADLTGLEKIQESLFEGMFNLDSRKEVRKYSELLNETTFYSVYIRMVNSLMTTQLTKFIVAGNDDGTTFVKRPEQMAEVILLLLSTWFIDALYPTMPENFFDKLETAGEVLKNSGVDVLNDSFVMKITNEIIDINQSI